MIVMMMILCSSRRRKKSRRKHDIGAKIKQSLHVPNPQQHTHDTSHQLQHNYTDIATLQLGVEVEPKSKLETVNNALYLSSKVKSLDSSLQHDDVIITPNPSHAVGLNSPETGQECEYHYYDYVQTYDGSVQHDKVVGATTSGRECSEVVDPAVNVSIDPNPSHSLPQDVKLEDNPSYTQMLAIS